MWRRFTSNRWGHRSDMGYRRRSFVTYSFSATLIVVCLAVIVGLYLLGYLDL
jgi:hypothetical protein